MSTFEKICKSDHVLLWLGDDKYSEVKLLQVRSGMGNIADWQRLAESIDHVHERNQSAKYNRRVSRGTASVKTPTKKLVPPPPARAMSKRDRKISIDYKQLHEDGIYEEKKRKIEKFPPKTSGPSEIRIAAQNQIIQHKKSPLAASRKTREVKSPASKQTSGYLPRRAINVTHQLIKQEHRSFEVTKPVKPEPGIYMRHRERPSDRERQWRYVHVSGRRCHQGGALDCNSQSENEGDEETLPDLITPPACTGRPTHPTSTNHQISGNINVDADIHLISPPVVERRSYVPNVPMDTRERNLGDLLCTLNFDGYTPDNEMPRPVTSSNRQLVPTPTEIDTYDASVRKVVTREPGVDMLSELEVIARNVVTADPATNTLDHFSSELDETRKVVTHTQS